jgi:hypothetical protein
MAPDTPGAMDPAESCTTTGSFHDHGIPDGYELVTRTYTRLVAGTDVEYEPTESFFDRLAAAFTWAYLGSVEEPGVPAHVEAAIDDARVATAEEFADDPGADLRTEVLPAFYRWVADYHCAYRH